MSFINVHTGEAGAQAGESRVTKNIKTKKIGKRSESRKRAKSRRKRREKGFSTPLIERIKVINSIFHDYEASAKAHGSSSESTKSIADYFIVKINQCTQDLCYMQDISASIPHDSKVSLKICELLEITSRNAIKIVSDSGMMDSSKINFALIYYVQAYAAMQSGKIRRAIANLEMAIQYQKEYLNDLIAGRGNVRFEAEGYPLLNHGEDIQDPQYMEEGTLSKRIQEKYDKEYFLLIKMLWLKCDVNECRNNLQQCIEIYNETMDMISTNYGRSNPAYQETSKRKGKVVLKMSKKYSSKTKKNLIIKNSIFSPAKPIISSTKASRGSSRKKRRQKLFDSLNQKATFLIEKSTRNMNFNVEPKMKLGLRSTIDESFDRSFSSRTSTKPLYFPFPNTKIGDGTKIIKRPKSAFRKDKSFYSTKGREKSSGKSFFIKTSIKPTMKTAFYNSKSGKGKRIFSNRKPSNSSGNSSILDDKHHTDRYKLLQATSNPSFMAPRIGNMKQNMGAPVYEPYKETNSQLSSMEKDYLNRYPLTHSEISDIIQRRTGSSKAGSSSVHDSLTGKPAQPGDYPPTHDFVKRTEIKHLFEQMVQENQEKIKEPVDTKSFRNIGEFSKALLIETPKTKKKSKKEKSQNVYVHIEIKQEVATKQIRVFVKDIMQRRDYEVLVSPILLPLSDEDLLSYITKALKVQYGKDGELKFFFDEFKRRKNKIGNSRRDNPSIEPSSQRQKLEIDINDLEEFKREKNDQIKEESQQSLPQNINISSFHPKPSDKNTPPHKKSHLQTPSSPSNPPNPTPIPHQVQITHQSNIFPSTSSKSPSPPLSPHPQPTSPKSPCSSNSDLHLESAQSRSSGKEDYKVEVKSSEKSASEITEQIDEAISESDIKEELESSQNKSEDNIENKGQIEEKLEEEKVASQVKNVRCRRDNPSLPYPRLQPPYNHHRTPSNPPNSLQIFPKTPSPSQNPAPTLSSPEQNFDHEDPQISESIKEESGMGDWYPQSQSFDKIQF
ncbi:unnamed protein product [Moneuplotes crassus]|uniref:Uncharacterized protein n=1 Tax=Euplotes crassus TaxID=5936 RepID=A0AAD2CZE1_EUPCR|nr:unnamed protein product [Moneuplotes crassus]